MHTHPPTMFKHKRTLAIGTIMLEVIQKHDDMFGAFRIIPLGGQQQLNFILGGIEIMRCALLYFERHKIVGFMRLLLPAAFTIRPKGCSRRIESIITFLHHG
jgi:hypothetical protein